MEKVIKEFENVKNVMSSVKMKKKKEIEVVDKRIVK